MTCVAEHIMYILVQYYTFHFVSLRTILWMKILVGELEVMRGNQLE